MDLRARSSETTSNGKGGATELHYRHLKMPILLELKLPASVSLSSASSLKLASFSFEGGFSEHKCKVHNFQ